MKTSSLWHKAVVVALLALMLALVIPAKEALACSGPGCPTTYRVRCGDTLSSIARRYCVSVWDLARWNHICNVNRIYVGQRLVIYGGCCYGCWGGGYGGFVHIVRCGETLSSIARMYGTTVWAIANANGIYNVNYIYAGQRLYIP